MAVHDTIGDFLTTIRNASRAEKRSCVTSFSKMRASIARILKEEGYIAGTREVQEEGKAKQLEITFKYVDGQSALAGINRYSKPGCRMYSKYDDIPRTLGGLGISILTTSKGLMKDTDARQQKVGGEIVCTVW